ncbi:hypothetical protein [Sulfurovum mangrovi]|uniref:hypothetical protein n=1 Tax=Sulfurovum mangrovi TaxID=2893889 RepID=UPI001E615274|nr:hypothetical protein [Sulfurovum mangrovi]UFH60378.1 hypothetical protein LN246_05865 [Sulfurovum mangrovi]
MNGIGIVIGIIFVVSCIIVPIVFILRAPYINLIEKIVWFLLSILGLPIAFIMDYPYHQAIKNATSQEEINQLIATHHATSFPQVTFVFWALAIFLIFKISYARKQGIWEKENKRH